MNGWILGLHLFSAHFGDDDAVAKLRWFTPGVYAVAPSGLTVGTYRNSIDRQTAYGGWTWRTGADFGPFSDVTLTAAAASGYRESRVMPLVAAAATLGHGDYAPRLTWVPHRTHPVSLSIERRF